MSRGTDVAPMARRYRTANPGEFPDALTVQLQQEAVLRYGENPNQPAAVYGFAGSNLASLTNVRLAKSGKGGLSATNLMDVTRGMYLVGFFQKPAVAVMKHTIPSGVAVQLDGEDLADTYADARDADARSAFGSVVVFNTPVDKAAAETLVATYIEGVAAPEFGEGAMEILEQKKDLRAILFSNMGRMPRFAGDDTQGLYDLKVLPTGRVIAQKPYLSSIRSAKNLVLDPMVNKDGRAYTVERSPTPEELDDMLMAWYVNLGVRSNGIVFVQDGLTLAVGSGQQERIGAVEQAILKSIQKELDRQGIPYDALDIAASVPFLKPEPMRTTQKVLNWLMRRGMLTESPLEGAVCSSDAFFPFRDSVDTMARVGVSAIIQPGGSVRDHEVIAAVNQHDMAMAFTLERCFGHF